MQQPIKSVTAAKVSVRPDIPFSPMWKFALNVRLNGGTGSAFML
jgi:hypothetical protein